jgi:hypothetical protein
MNWSACTHEEFSKVLSRALSSLWKSPLFSYSFSNGMIWIFFKNVFRFVPPWSCGALGFTLQQIIAASFFLGVAHALPAVQFAARPIAADVAFDQDWKFRKEEYEVFLLSSRHQYASIFPFSYAGHQEDVPQLLSIWPEQQIASLEIGETDHNYFAVQSRTEGDGGIETNRAGIHRSTNPPHRPARLSQSVGNLIADRIESVRMVAQSGIPPSAASEQGFSVTFRFGERGPYGVQKHHSGRQAENDPVAAIFRNTERPTNVSAPLNCAVRRHALGDLFEFAPLPFHNSNDAAARVRRQGPTVPGLPREVPIQKETICPVTR